MAASDEHGAPADSILLFQFSRPQNLVYHWKFRVPLLKMHSMLDCGILIVINKFCELQKIYNASFTSKY